MEKLIKIPFIADFGHLNTASNQSSSCEIEELSFNISNLSIFRPSTNYATPRESPSIRIVWPAADTGGIPPEGGIEAAYKRQLAESEDPEALRAELYARIESARGPIGPLNRFQMEEMIDPRDTRRYVCDWVKDAYRIVSHPGNLGPRAIQFRP